MDYKSGALRCTLCRMCNNLKYETITVPIHVSSSSMYYGTQKAYSCSKKVFKDRKNIPEKYECDVFKDKKAKKAR